MSTTTLTSPSRPITVTTAQLAALLAQHRGATFVGFTALTTPEGRKTPFGVVKKLVKVNAVTGAYYDRALLKTAGREAQEERAWGQHEDSLLVEKTFYLPTQNPRYSRPLYLIESANGKLTMVPADQVKPFLRQRPEVPVLKRDFRLDHICSLSLNGRRYRVRPDPTITTT
jgi:hypothetical protein